MPGSLCLVFACGCCSESEDSLNLLRIQHSNSLCEYVSFFFLELRVHHCAVHSVHNSLLLHLANRASFTCKTDSFSWGHGPDALACKARPSSDQCGTSLSVSLSLSLSARQCIDLPSICSHPAHLRTDIARLRSRECAHQMPRRSLCCDGFVRVCHRQNPREMPSWPHPCPNLHFTKPDSLYVLIPQSLCSTVQGIEQLDFVHRTFPTQVIMSQLLILTCVHHRPDILLDCLCLSGPCCSCLSGRLPLPLVFHGDFTLLQQPLPSCPHIHSYDMLHQTLDCLDPCCCSLIAWHLLCL